MLPLTKKYRTDYAGEDVVVDRTLENRAWSATKETIPNRVTNTQISNKAVVIGNGINRLGFELTNLKKPSGLLGSKTVQTYGCNALHRDFTPDFLVALGQDVLLQEISTSDYIKNNVVYARASTLLNYPGKFYLVPHDNFVDAGTTAAYIAAFDGHKKIYLIGFDGHQPGWNNNVYAGTTGYDDKTKDVMHNSWEKHKKQLFDVYDDVDWVWVTPHGSNTIPESLKYCENFRQISFRKLVIECDL